MKIPQNAIIPDRKLTDYLLIYQTRSDKSKFLAQAGFTANNPEALKRAIQATIEKFDAIEDLRNQYGIYYRVDGDLIGLNGVILQVSLIWIQQREQEPFRFVTLKPLKEKKP